MTRSAGLYRLGLAVLTVALLSMAADAQPPGGGRGGPGGPGGPGGFAGGRGPGGGSSFGLLGNPQVQEELDLTEEQVEKLSALRDELRDRMKGQVQGLGFSREMIADLNEGERRAKIDEFREKTRELYKKAEKHSAELIQGVLVPAQIQRLEQITLQQQGVRALRNEKVIKALGITEEQQEKLRQIGDVAQKQVAGVLRAVAGFTDMTREERIKKFEEIRANSEKLQRESQTKAMAVLSDEQKKTLGEMMGEPFELKRQERDGRQFQGRGGARGRGGPGGERGQRPGGGRPPRPEA